MKKEKTLTVDGMAAHRLTGPVTPGPTDEYDGYQLDIVVVDTGNPNQLGVWISFHPSGTPNPSNSSPRPSRPCTGADCFRSLPLGWWLCRGGSRR